MAETLAYGYSYESTQQELSNEYQQDRVLNDFQKSLHSCALDEISLSIGRVNLKEHLKVKVFPFIVLYPPNCSQDLPPLAGLYTWKPFQSPGGYSRAAGSI